MSVTLDPGAAFSPPPADTHSPRADVLSDLVAAAVRGDQRAWAALHDRYAPLIATVCRRHPLAHNDAEDVGQVVWLRLVVHLKGLRDPRALPGWIVTTARNECLRVIESRRRTQPADPTCDRRFDAVDTADPVDHLHRLEQRRALYNGVARLRPERRQLLLLLLADPEIPYREISRRLGIPIGSIGPTRARCLRQLRAMTATPSPTANAQTRNGRWIPAAASSLPTGPQQLTA